MHARNAMMSAHWRQSPPSVQPLRGSPPVCYCTWWISKAEQAEDDASWLLLPACRVMQLKSTFLDFFYLMNTTYIFKLLCPSLSDRIAVITCNLQIEPEMTPTSLQRSRTRPRWALKTDLYKPQRCMWKQVSTLLLFLPPIRHQERSEVCFFTSNWALAELCMRTCVVLGTLTWIL